MTFAAEYWKKAGWPLKDKFRSELGALYLLALKDGNRVLPTDIAKTILDTAANLYAVEFPSELTYPHDRHLNKLINPHRTYKVVLESFLKSIVGFAREFPHCRTIEEPPRPAFAVPFAFFYDPVTTAAAYDALGKPFTGDGRRELDECGVFNWDNFQPYAWSTFSVEEPRFDKSEPGPDADKYDKWRYRKEFREFKETVHKRWKEEKEAYEREHKDTHKDVTWTPLLNTPYWGRGLDCFAPIPIPFDIPPQRWFEGTWIVAPPGRGKTNLLRHLVLNAPKDDASIIVMDAKGELLNSFSRMKQLADKLVLLDPNPEYPLAINPLDIGGHSIEFLEYLFASLLESKMTPSQSTLFRLVLTLLTKIPGATLETFRDIIQNGVKPYEQHVRQLSKRDQDFFDKEFNGKMYNERKPEILWRLRLLTTNPCLDAMFQAPKTKLDIGALMDSGKFICINNNYELLGDQGAEFFGRFFVALVWAAARRRSRLPDHKKKPVFFFIDEAHYVIARDTKIAAILDQCRAQKIAMIFAHQRVDQIKDDDVKTALTNCAIKFANPTGEVHELASRLHTTTEFLEAQTVGTFACYARDKTKTAVSVPVPLQDMDRFERMSDIEFHALSLTMRARYCSGYEEPQPRSAEAPHYDLHWTTTISPRMARDGGIKREQGYDIKILAGTKNGTRLRLRGKGVLRPDDTRGDVIITIRVPEQPRDGEPAGLGDRSGKENW
jgi:hypothetical protein